MYQQQEEEKRRTEIGQYFIFLENRPSWLQLYRISESWWLDYKNISLQQVKDCIKKKINKINADILDLEDLKAEGLENYEEIALAEYKRTLNLEKAKKRAQQQKEDDRNPESASFKSKLYKEQHTWKNKKHEEE